MIARVREALGVDEQGISLVELLVTILISGIVGAAVLTGVVTMNRTERTMQSVRDNIDEARLSLDRIRIELRGARRIFEDPDGTHLQFWIDLDNNDTISSNELVHYELVDDGDHARLERWTADDPDARRVVARGLLYDADDPDAVPPFTYDRDPPETRLIDIALVVDVGARGGVDPKPVEAQVRLRNVQ